MATNLLFWANFPDYLLNSINTLSSYLYGKKSDKSSKCYQPSACSVSHPNRGFSHITLFSCSAKFPLNAVFLGRTIEISWFRNRIPITQVNFGRLKNSRDRRTPCINYRILAIKRRPYIYF